MKLRHAAALGLLLVAVVPAAHGQAWRHLQYRPPPPPPNFALMAAMQRARLQSLVLVAGEDRLLQVQRPEPDVVPRDESKPPSKLADKAGETDPEIADAERVLKEAKIATDGP